MVTEPVRDTVSGFAAKLRVTVPLVVPELPLLTAIQGELDAADQLHPDTVVTPTDPLPAPFPVLMFAVLSV